MLDGFKGHLLEQSGCSTGKVDRLATIHGDHAGQSDGRAVEEERVEYAGGHV